MIPLVADLRSDTVTRPTPGMAQAMASAQVGDDVFGEDPTVTALQERVAELTGHEAALFMPTGSMSNQVALRVHVQPGQEVLCDHLAHIVRAELGAAAALGGITTRTWVGDRGRLDPAVPLALMVPDGGAYFVSTALVEVEVTHNFGGGTVIPVPTLRTLAQGCRAAGVPVHLDGARLWHAAVATGSPLADFAATADSLSLCFSKGLGAPVGSMLVGGRAFIEAARIWRKRYGGGMRQVGVLAAAASYALDHHLDRLAQDHEHARSFARAVSGAGGARVDLDRCETNIVLLDLDETPWSATGLVAALGARGVAALPTTPTQVRFVWHLDVSREASEQAAAIVVDLLTAGPAGDSPGGGGEGAP